MADGVTLLIGPKALAAPWPSTRTPGTPNCSSSPRTRSARRSSRWSASGPASSRCPRSSRSSPRGTALTHRIAVDAQLAGTQILVIDTQGTAVRRAPRARRPTWLPPRRRRHAARAAHPHARRASTCRSTARRPRSSTSRRSGRRWCRRRCLKPRQRVRMVLAVEPYLDQGDRHRRVGAVRNPEGRARPRTTARDWSSPRPIPSRSCSSASSRPPRPRRARPTPSADPNHAAVSGSLRTMVSSRPAPVETSSTGTPISCSRRSHVRPRLGREVVEASSTPAVGVAPAGHRLEHGRARAATAAGRPETPSQRSPPADAVADADRHRGQAVEHVQLRDHHGIEAVHAHGVPDLDRVEPAAAPRTAGHGAELVAPGAQRLAVGAVQLRRKRPLAHPRRVGLGDPEHRVHRSRPDAQPGAGAADGRVRRRDVGVGAVIEVEHRALGPFEQDRPSRRPSHA